MKKLIILTLCFLTNLSNAFAIEGEYRITEAKSPDGKSYTGSVIIKPVGDAYMLKWQLAQTGEQYSGIGLLQNDVLSVAWGAGEAAGVVSYKVEGKKLVGTWAMPPTGKAGKETLEKQG